jgi:DNA mismatch repair protein MutL
VTPCFFDSDVTRNPIRQLPPNLVNRIAAGEVIERPASVVKECVENALDAGAKNITVEIEDGGKQLIRIIDDGIGIVPEQLPLAFASHATSKITTDDDLFRISTMGFRGEALASIGSVSLARILSRTPASESAYEIENRGGAISQPVARAGNVGTTIEVRELFFNVPARRKFLKGSGTESGHVSDTLLRLALARPDASFKLVSGGRVTLDLPSVEPTLRWLEAWPNEFATAKLDLDARADDIRVRGVIGFPDLAQPHSRHQYTFVNGRHVRDKFVGHALKEAYRGLTEPGRNPAAILFIDVPADAVDVNVHPTKSEVRFRDSSRVHGFVLSVVREKLLANDFTPRAMPTAWNGTPAQSQDDAQRGSMRQQLADFFRTGTTSAPNAANPTFGVGGHYLPSLPDTSTAQVAPTASPAPYAPAVPQLPTEIIPAIQLHNSYLVVESDDGLVIIDQHALHERILFEEFLAKLRRGRLESQRMLIPIVIKATPQQIDALAKLSAVFELIGIDAAPIGPEAVAVNAFPSFLDRLDPGEFVADVLAKAEDDAAILDHESLLHETLDMMACKAAVKAGDPLTPEEIKTLVERRHLVERSSNCPHGRPTTLRLTLRDLEKQFKRSGF